MVQEKNGVCGSFVSVWSYQTGKLDGLTIGRRRRAQIAQPAKTASDTLMDRCMRTILELVVESIVHCFRANLGYNIRGEVEPEHLHRRVA